MTDQQYERWKDFAMRMARTCFRHLRRPSSHWVIEQVESWFYWRDHQQDWGNYSSWDQDSPYCLCDHVSEFYSDLESYSYSEDEEVDYKAQEQFQAQWMGPILSCLRAGIDVAVEPSAGVVGFTAGDIRQMYPEGLPLWLLDVFAGYSQETTSVAVVPGVGFVPETKVVESAPFDQWPDETNVWL